MRCQVEHATNAYLREQEEQEKNCEEALKELELVIDEDYLQDIQDKIDIVKSLAKDFNGFNLIEEVKEILMDKLDI